MKPSLPDLVSPSSVAPPGHRSRLLLATTILHGSRTGDECHTTQVVSADGEMERLAATAGLLGRGLSYVVVSFLGPQGSLNQIWRRVIPMLICWKVLVPLKSLAGFESAIITLEQMSRKPEVIELAQTGNVPGSVPDGGGDRQQDMTPHFYLP